MARPREFDRTEALEKAMQLFWAQGYADTSIGELVKHTGVNRHSLYSEFGSKWDLFDESMTFYMENSIKFRTAALRRPDASWPEIVEFLEQFLEAVDHPLAKYGCLVCNTGAELGASNPLAAKMFDDYLGVIRVLLENALRRAQEKEEIEQGQSPEAVSKFLTNTVVGISISVKTEAGREAIPDIVRLALRALRIT